MKEELINARRDSSSREKAIVQQMESKYNKVINALQTNLNSVISECEKLAVQVANLKNAGESQLNNVKKLEDLLSSALERENRLKTELDAEISNSTKLQVYIVIMGFFI
jgi:prophage DNA circulation protein